jgi:hypothetical protein
MGGGFKKWSLTVHIIEKIGRWFHLLGLGGCPVGGVDRDENDTH